MKTLENLVPKLLEKTRDGSLDWTQGLSDQQFNVPIGKNLISVWSWTSEEDGTDGVSIGIRPINALTMSDAIAFDKYSAQYDKLYELYATARRNALKVDRMIIEVEKDLDELFPF